jgi:hypothetical protein
MSFILQIIDQEIQNCPPPQIGSSIGHDGAASFSPFLPMFFQSIIGQLHFLV